MTGTPVQNKLDDLGSLVSFLRVPVLGESAQFRRHIIRQTRSSKNNHQPDFENLRLLVGAICLRRNKSTLSFSQSVERIHEVELSASESQAYRKLGDAWRKAIDEAISGYKSKEAHQTVLEALLRMRMFCNNGEVLRMDCFDALTEPDQLGSLLQQQGEAVCYHCSCDILLFSDSKMSDSGVVTECRSVVCGDCVPRYEEEARKRGACTICKRLHVLPSDVRNGVTNQDGLEDRPFPSKLLTLCKDIERHRTENKRQVFRPMFTR